MAGTNQAANLTGMLTSIGNTIGGMGAVGQQFVNPIVNMSRPDVDPNSLEDMQRLQQWQQTVGREDAARTTGMTLRDLEEAARAKKKDDLLLSRGQFMQQTMQNDSAISASAANGDVEAYNYYLKQQQDALKKQALVDPEGARAGWQDLQQKGSAQMREAVQEKAADNKALGVLQYDNMIEGMSEDDDRRDKLKATRDALLDDPVVRAKYGEKRVELAEIQARQNEASFLQDQKVISGRIVAAGGDPDRLDAIRKEYPQYASQVNEMINSNVGTIDLLRNLRDSNAAPDFGAFYTQLDESNLTEDQAKILRSSAKKIEGSTEKTERMKRQELEKLVAQALSAGLNNSANDRARNAEKAVREEVYVEELARIASVGPDEEDVRETAVYLASLESFDEDDLAEDPDAMRKFTEKARQYESNRLANIQRRELIRLGKADPLELDDKDRAAIQTAVKAGENVVQLIDYMVRQGYGQEAVEKAFLDVAKKQLKNVSAEDIRTEVSTVMAEVAEEDKVFKSQKLIKYDERKKQRGTAGLERPESTTVAGESAKAKLRSNRFEMPTLTPLRNKLKEARDKQAQGQGFRYNSSVLELFQGDATNRRR